MLGSQVAEGQERRTKTTTLFPGVEGSVEYGFRLAKGDTLLMGEWRARSSHRDTTDPSLVTGLEWNGSLDQGLKNGAWTYSAKALRVDDKPMVQGFQVVKNASGTDHQVQAGFIAGKANGSWRMVEQRIQDSRSVDTLAYVEASFNSGHFVGAMEGTLGAVKFSGGFDPEGLVHGEWRIQHRMAAGSPVVELRRYENGILREQLFEQGTRTARVEHVGLDLNVGTNDPGLKVIILDKGSLELFSIAARAPSLPGLSAADMDSISKAGSTIMLEAISALTSHEGRAIWQVAPGSDRPEAAKVRMKEYRFSGAESQARTELLRRYQEAQDLLTRFFADPLTDLGRHAYEDIEAYHAILEVYRERLSRLAPALKVVEHPLVQFIDRNALLPAIVPSLDQPASVSFTFKERTVERGHAFPAPLLPEGISLMTLDHHVEAILKDVRGTTRKVELILDRYKTQSQLVEKEERLVYLRDSIRQLFRNEAGRDDHNSFHVGVADQVVDLVTNSFKTYAAATLDVKIDRIDALLDCYREILEFYSQLARIPIRLQRIEEAYTRSVWNPYTYTFMEERVKDRLYRAYDTVILPYLGSGLQQSIECGRMFNATDGYVELYRRMLDLREQDTKELERELRRITDAAAALDILYAVDGPEPLSE